MLTLISFAVVLGVLIFVHELGHFLAAKWVGIGVPRFSIGFGAATPLRFRRGETEYVLAWIPLGGYVKMASREELEAMSSVEGGPTEEQWPEDKLFENKPLWARVFVISAGVLMNAFFAFVVYTAITAAVGRTEDPTTRIARVETRSLPEAAARLATIPSGTQVLRVNGDSIRSWEALLEAVTDVTSPRLRFDFAGGVEPVIVEIAGTAQVARFAIAEALRPEWPATIGLTSPGLPADRAGISAGDRILAIDGDSVRFWDDLKVAIEAGAGDTLAFTVARADSLFTTDVIPMEQRVSDPMTGEDRTIGWVGIGPQRDLRRIEYGPLQSVAAGASDTWNNIVAVVLTVRGMFVGDVSTRELGGPILIAQVSGQAASAGAAPFFTFMAFLSVNLAVLNLLPIPVLDGGHLVFLAIEGLRGKPVSVGWRIKLTQVGMIVLLGILVLVFRNDLLRIFG